MFMRTITHADGERATGTATEADALRLLRTAVRRGFRVEVTRSGGAIIERDMYDGRSTLPRTHTVKLEPVTPVGKLTATVRECLSDIARREAFRIDAAEPEFRHQVGRISAGLRGVGPAAATRLVDRGLVVLGKPYASMSNGTSPRPARRSASRSPPVWPCTPRTTAPTPLPPPDTSAPPTSDCTR